MAEITWGNLWWRVKLLARVWYSDARRWVVVRRRARRLGPAWRRPSYANLTAMGQMISRAQGGAPIEATPRQMLDAMHDVRAQSPLNQLGAHGFIGGYIFGARAAQQQAKEYRRLELLRRMQEERLRMETKWGDW